MTLVTPDQASTATPFAEGLRAYGDRVAVVTPKETISYAELDERVGALAARLGTDRRLVLVGAANAVEPLIAYLAALQAGHPVLLVPGDNDATAAALAGAYDPDVVIAAHDGWAIHERHARSAHNLHPDLALLLSTSGSTGSSKLVRLSRQNLQANADSIADFLEITAHDRAITTLPMQYCYGLSVINSHLLCGAGLVMTELSVVDRCFWDLFHRARATSFAGVPHTFDLLDRAGFDSMSLPTLRCITQAGGRLHPDKVSRYAALGERDGWRLFVMYGQTEATARMAYLPPTLATSHPNAIGVAVPHGSLSIESPDEDGVGELVYRGPNVMLGYAEEPADLALGATIDALHTGDLARVNREGLFEVVGRQSRFVKMFGLRIDLDRVERLLAEHGVIAMCAGDDDELILAIEDAAHARSVSRLVGDHLGLPHSRIHVLELDELPRLSNGKPDYATIHRHGTADRRTREASSPSVLSADGSDHDRALRASFIEILGCEPSGGDSFVGLGGDSLSYVEMSIRLEQILGFLPPDWHTTPISELAPSSRRRRLVAQTDTSVVLRAVAIVLVVGTHTRLWHLPGGAHTLLGVAGYNFARFQLRATAMLPSIARIALPSMLWIGIVAAIADDYHWQHALLVNGLFGAIDNRWSYWYVEAIVQMLVPLALLFASPGARRLERRRPFLFAVAVALAGLAVRFDLLDLPPAHHRLSQPHEIFWLFALGWAAARATSAARRVVVSVLVITAVPGFFGATQREVFVATGLLLMIWLPTVHVPRLANRAIGVVAGASLYIYLTHWQVYPPILRHYGPVLALGGSVLVGIAAWLAGQRIIALAECCGRLLATGRATPSLTTGSKDSSAALVSPHLIS